MNYLTNRFTNRKLTLVISEFDGLQKYVSKYQVSKISHDFYMYLYRHETKLAFVKILSKQRL